MSAQLIQPIGSTLLHFFWQGVALAVLLAAAMIFTRNARVRYGLSVLTLALMALCPVMTLATLERFTPASSVTTVEPQALPAPVLTNIGFVLSDAAPVNSFEWLSCLVWIWCGGVCLFTARAFGGWLMLQKLRSTAQDAIPEVLLQRCRHLQERIGISAKVCYAYSEVVDAPAVVGWFRPVVLIPLSAVSGLTVAQLDAIIAHELAHIRRYDALVNLFQVSVETALFYHPAVWWVNRVIRTERENCCDDVAVAVCGNATEYARALAAMSDGQPGWAMAANGGALKARVGRLLGMQKITHGIPRAGLVAFSLICASCLLLAAKGLRQEPPIPPPPPLPPPAASVPPVSAVPPVAPPAAPAPPRTPRVAEDLESVEIQQKLAAEQNKLSHLSQKLAREVSADVLGADVQIAALAMSLQQTQAEPEKKSGPSYIDSLASVGLTNLSVDDLIALKTQGVTPEYIREIKATGMDASVRELIGMKVQGITPEYIRDIRATGLKPNLHELMGMKVQGITPAFIQAMQSAGLGELKIHDFIGAKTQGVTPEFIEKVRAHGFKNLTLRQLIGLKMADVF